MNKNKAIIVCVIIVVVTIIAAFYILSSGKTPVSSNSNQAFVALEKQPSKTLREYVDDAGFSFKYPEDVQINEKDVANDLTAYASLKISSSQAKGSISINVLDTKLKSVDDWFLENNYTSTKEIKIAEMFGKEANMNNKITAVALDQSVLFTIEVDSQGQKYWVDIYETILSSFNFVPSQVSSLQSSDSSPDDVVLQEETVE